MGHVTLCLVCIGELQSAIRYCPKSDLWLATVANDFHFLQLMHCSRRLSHFWQYEQSEFTAENVDESKTVFSSQINVGQQRSTCRFILKMI